MSVTEWTVRFVVGLVLILAGIAMLVLPGQGILTIVVGLFVWAPLFRWADRLSFWSATRILRAGDRLPVRLRRRLEDIVARHDRDNDGTFDE